MRSNFPGLVNECSDTEIPDQSELLALKKHVGWFDVAMD